MIGEILGNRYEIVEKIGEGGMSVVYKARCNKLDRFVAVKILKKEFCDNEDIINKFKREATAVATLSDNNIVNVLDVGTQDDINYIVMEYVDGKTLKEVIKEFGKLNYETCIKIGVQIARALECAHKNNIIHRDVKPQNILVTDDGAIKVTDFGIAKSSGSATLTNTTTIMGSAQYFSPEQAKGTFVDARTDLYSLGVVLYEMATGQLPFEADSPVSIALKHIQEKPVAPKQVNSRIPESLNNLILKAMEKEPNKRYQTAKEMISDLQKIQNDPNAIIGTGKEDDEDDDGKTIVMTAVNPSIIDQQENSVTSDDDDDDEYYDDYDDDYDDEEDDEEDHRKKSFIKKINKKMIIGIVSAIALILLGVGAVYALSSTSSKDVVVPNIKGMSLDEAKKALSDKGLVLEEGGTESSDEPEGTVIEVNPTEGSTVKSGSKVRVILSEGATKLTVPNLKDSTLEDAQTILKRKKLNYTVSYENSDSIEKGNVVRTDPDADSEVKEGDTITIFVSNGPSVQYIKVPSVEGMSKDAAVEAIQNAGLVCNVQTENSTEANNGKVIRTSKGGGSTVAKGSSVTIVVGTYTPPASNNSNNNDDNGKGDDKKDPGKSDPEKPDPAKPDPAKPDPAKPDPAKPDPAQPDPAKPDPNKEKKN